MNIGNETTSANGLFISVDWLSFTIKNIMTVSQVIDLFGLNPEQMQDGLVDHFGYRSHMKHRIYPVSILYDGNEDMGIHVDVSGSAVGYFLQCYANRHTDKPTPFNSFAYEVETSFPVMLCAYLFTVWNENFHFHFPHISYGITLQLIFVLIISTKRGIVVSTI